MESQPLYELKAVQHGPSDLELEVWQLPSNATPNLTQRLRVAGLRGRNLALVEHRVLKRFKERGIEVAGLLPETPMSWRLPEDLALNLGILFRALAPMRNADYMRTVADGIERMGREEAAYWLGMAMHRRYPRRVLTALRMLLVDPNKGGKDR